MTQTQIDTAAATCSSHRNSDRRLVAVTTGAAGLAYLAWRSDGLHLAVRSRHGTTEVGLISVLVTAAVVSTAGLALLRSLERRDPRGLGTWTLVACTVGAVSLVGPLGATTLSAGLALLSLHLVVGTVLVVGALHSRRCGVA
jgi:hypothetical protein